MDIFEQAAEQLSSASDELMTRISSTVQVMGMQEKRVEILEAELKQAKEDLRRTQEDILPNLLSECGLSEVTTNDGTKLVINRYYSVSINKERQEEVFEWLRDQGQGDLVKNVVSASFGKQEDAQAEQLRTNLTNSGYNVQTKTWVEPMTLKAWGKEWFENGGSFHDGINFFAGSKAAIKKGRK